MKARIAVASAIIAAATVMLASIPAEATHKPYCGKKWVETGTFYVDKFCGSKPKIAIKSAKSKCLAELKERGQYTYASNFMGLEKTGAHCVLEKEGDICKFWCVCSAEACWKPYLVKPPRNFSFQRDPFPDPPGKGLRVPSRPPSGGLSIPNLRRR